MSQTKTATATYTVIDIENVVRRVKADFLMIASSTGAWTPDEAASYAHDVEVLAKAGYLASVDVTLLSGSVEIQAAKFDVNTNAGSLTSSRPGGVLWKKVANAHLRVVLTHTPSFTDDAKSSTKGKLRHTWSPTSDDISHSKLGAMGGRDYASNAFGMQRKDWVA